MVRQLNASPADILERYRLEPHRAFQLVACNKRRDFAYACGERLAAANPGGGARPLVLSRGEPGALLFDRLRRAWDWPRFRFIYEAHRFCEARPLRLGRLRAPHPWRAVEMRRLERAVVERADALLFLTTSLAEAMAARYRIRQSQLVLPSGGPSPVAELPPDSERDVDILYAGKLERRKGVEDLIRALVHLPAHRLHVLGGDAAQIAQHHALAEREGVAARVSFEGLQDPAATRGWMSRARVGVCPLPSGESEISEKFTSPLKVIEMMALGTPIVATDLPSIRTVLEPEATAQIVPPSDPEALAAGIRRLLDDRFLARRLATNALAEAARYAWSARARKLFDFLAALE